MLGFYINMKSLDEAAVSGDVKTEGGDAISANIGSSVRSIDHLTISNVNTNVDDVATSSA